jgi:hypothetical protein
MNTIESMEKLRELAPRINAASDAITEQIGRIESELNALGLGATAEVADELSHASIAYKRPAGKTAWGIWYYASSASDPVLLTNAPRTVRVHAIEEGLIEQLLERLAAHSEALAINLESTADAAEKTLDAGGGR